MLRRWMFGAMLVVLLGLALSALVARQRSVDGSLQPVTSSDARGSWRVAGPAAPPAAQTGQTADPDLMYPAGTRQLDEPVFDLDIARHLDPQDTTVALFMGIPQEPFVTSGPGRMALALPDKSAVVVARAVESKGEFIAPPLWIKSMVTFVAEQILKKGEGMAALSVGQRFDVLMDGGEVMVGQTRVIARHRAERLTQPGKQYLLYLSEGMSLLEGHPQVLLSRGSSETFEIRGSSLIRMLTPSFASSDAGVLDASEVLGEISARYPFPEAKN